MWQEWDVIGEDKRLSITAIVHTPRGVIETRRPERRLWILGEDVNSTLRRESLY